MVVGIKWMVIEIELHLTSLTEEDVMRADKFKFLKPNKYRNQSVVLDGIRFASKREASRFLELSLLAKSGKIRDLNTQVRFKLVCNGQHITTYVADFTYEEWVDEDWRAIVEDVKGVRTDVYKLKRKLMLAVHGVEIREV